MAGFADELVDYVSRRDPAFAGRLRGATPAEVAELAELVGRPLPDQYRQFLALLGHSDDEFALASLGTTDVDVVIGYYRDARIGEVSQPPPDCIVIGTGDLAVGELCLRFGDRPEPEVVYSMDGHVRAPCAGSLRTLLFRTAFTRHHLARPCRGVWTGQGPGRYAGALRLAADLGFTREWFSDDRSYCGERGDAGLYLQGDERRVWLCAGAATEELVDEVGAAFGPAGAGLVDRRPPPADPRYTTRNG